jgi:hypothetical protein
MTTTFLDIPQQASLHAYLVDDVDIEAPLAPSLLQQLATRYNDLCQKLPWATPSSTALLPSSCLLSWHHLREAVVVADSNKLHIYLFPSQNRQHHQAGGWLNPIVTPARPVKSVAWSTLSNTLIVGSNDGRSVGRQSLTDQFALTSCSLSPSLSHHIHIQACTCGACPLWITPA